GVPGPSRAQDILCPSAPLPSGLGRGGGGDRGGSRLSAGQLAEWTPERTGLPRPDQDRRAHRLSGVTRPVGQWGHARLVSTRYTNQDRKSTRLNSSHL